MVKNEVHNLMELDHPHVVKLVEYFEESDKDEIFLIFELCRGPDLFDRLVDVVGSQGKFPEQEAGRVLRQMLKAVLACHENHIIHRDIKPENFMFKNNFSKSAIKMIDLGLSEHYREGETFTECSGTIAYMSPEMICGHPYDRKCDIWSLGVIFWANREPLIGPLRVMKKVFFLHSLWKRCFKNNLLLPLNSPLKHSVDYVIRRTSLHTFL